MINTCLALLLAASSVLRPAAGTLVSSSKLEICNDFGDDGVKCNQKMVVSLTVAGGQRETERITLHSVIDERDPSSETYGTLLNLTRPIEITFTKTRPRLRYGMQFVRFVNWGPIEMFTPVKYGANMLGSMMPDCALFPAMWDPQTEEMVVGNGQCCGCDGFRFFSNSIKRVPFSDGCPSFQSSRSSTLQYVLHPMWASVYKVLPPMYAFDVIVRVNDPDGRLFNEDTLGSPNATGTGDWRYVDSAIPEDNIWETRVGPTDRLATSPIGHLKLVGDFVSYQGVPLMENNYVVVRSVCKAINGVGSDEITRLTEECEAARGHFADASNWLVLPQHLFKQECDHIGVSYDEWASVGGVGGFCKHLSGTCLNNQLRHYYDDYIDDQQLRHRYGIAEQYPTLELLGTGLNPDTLNLAIDADHLWEGPAWSRYHAPLPLTPDELANGDYVAYFDTYTHFDMGESFVTLQLNADKVSFTQYVADGYFASVVAPDELREMTTQGAYSVVKAAVHNNDTVPGNFYVDFDCSNGKMEQVQQSMRSIAPNDTYEFRVHARDQSTTGGDYYCRLQLLDTLGNYLDSAYVNMTFEKINFSVPVPTDGEGNSGVNATVAEPALPQDQSTCAAACKSAFDLPCLLLKGCWEAFMTLAVIGVLLCCCLPPLVRFCSKRSAKTLQAFASGVSVLAHPSSWRRRKRQREQDDDQDDPKSPLVTNPNRTADIASTPSALNASMSLAYGNHSTSFDSVPGTPLNATTPMNLNSSFFVMTPRNAGPAASNFTGTIDVRDELDTPSALRPPPLSLNVDLAE